jgi:hypothetical protein
MKNDDFKMDVAFFDLFLATKSLALAIFGGALSNGRVSEI